MKQRYSDTDALRRKLAVMKTKDFMKQVWANKMARVGVIIHPDISEDGWTIY